MKAMTMFKTKNFVIFAAFIAFVSLDLGCSNDLFTSDDTSLGDASSDAVAPDLDVTNGDVLDAGSDESDPASDAGDSGTQADTEAGCPNSPFPNVTATCNDASATCLHSASITCEQSGAICAGNGLDGGAWLRCGGPSDCLTGHCCLTENDDGVVGCPNIITIEPGVGVGTVCDTSCSNTGLYHSEVCVTDADCSGNETCEYSVFSYAGGEFQHVGVCR